MCLAEHVKALIGDGVYARQSRGPDSLACCRRHVCEHLQQEAAARGQAAAMSTGAAATVDAAAAAGSLQVCLAS